MKKMMQHDHHENNPGDNPGAQRFILNKVSESLAEGRSTWRSQVQFCEAHGQYRAFEKPDGWTGCPDCLNASTPEASNSERQGAPRRAQRSAEEISTAAKATAFLRKRLAESRAGIENPWETKERVCTHHGVYTATETPVGWTGCPTCEREESVSLAEREHQKVAMSRFAKKTQEMLGSVQRLIPYRFDGATFDSYKPKTESQEQALDFAMRFVDRVAESPRGVPNLVLHGGTGVGKTHLGYAITREVARANRSVYRQTVAGLVDRLKASYSPATTENHAALINALSRVDVLVLDEVGTSIQNQHEAITLREVFDKRWEHGLPTVLLSNLEPASMANAVGGAPALSRLLSISGVAHVRGEDARMN